MAQDWTPEIRDLFLENLSQTGNVTEAARRTGVSRSRAYEIYADDKDFRSDWEIAEMDSVDVLEFEARRRAVEGIERPLYRGGLPIQGPGGAPVTVREYSDKLLMFLLNKAWGRNK